MTFLEHLGELLAGFADDSPPGVLAKDLYVLNDLEPGLGDRAIGYVLRAEHPECLVSITPQRAGPYLHVASSYYRRGLAERRIALTECGPERLDVVRRYGEVLAAAAGADPPHVPGSAAVADVARVLFAELFLAFAGACDERVLPGIASGEGFGPDAASRLAEHLGCSGTDLIDLIYTAPHGSGRASGERWRRHVDLRPSLAGAPADAVAAAARMPAGSREALVRDLGETGLASDPTYLEYVLDRCGDGAAGVRRAALDALGGVPPDVLEPRAVECLGTGKAAVRAAVVELLAGIATPSALTALAAHRKSERTARIAASIDNALAAGAMRRDAGDDGVGEGYVALDGRRIAVPAPSPLADAPPAEFGPDDVDELRALIDADNARRERWSKGEGARFGRRARPIDVAHARELVALFRDPVGPVGEGLGETAMICARAWTGDALTRLPDATALPLCARLSRHAVDDALAGDDGSDAPVPRRLDAFLRGPGGDLRHVESVAVDVGATVHFHLRRGMIEREHRPGDLLAKCLREGSYRYLDRLEALPREAVWPCIAEHLDVLDQAFGTAATEYSPLGRTQAVRALRLLPAVPARFLPPLLEIATGAVTAGRDEARELLAGVAEVGPRLFALLDDTRQDIRSGAAEWLGRRGDAGAVQALAKRAKRERSELARAAMLGALERLGEDLSPYVGTEALIAEAAKGAKSAKLDKLAWLRLDHPPTLAFADGVPVPDEVIRYWLHLAVKLKRPGGNALFELYLDRLEPASARALSTWLLDAWIDHDTARPSEAEANAHAVANAPAYFHQYGRLRPGYTLEQAVAMLRADFRGRYLASGAPTKGLLALATRVPAALVADRVGGYLRRHGARTAQASALLELAAANGGPAALQVVIAAATRLRQKGVQAFAGELVGRIAEARGWTLDELADRTVPSAGLDDDGTLALPVGEGGKAYVGHLDASLKLVVTNPAGKRVGSLPAGADDATQASRKRLSAARKEIKAVVAIQRARLYEAMCAERVWPVEHWRADLVEHPLMRHLVRRVVWVGLDADGTIAGTFRPTAEGDFTDADDDPVDPARFAGVRVAHGALVGEGLARAWTAHLVDYELEPLVAQFARPSLRLDDTGAAREATAVLDRQGWLTDSFTIRGAATKLGYERGRAEDGGGFHDYRKPFAAAGLAAVVDFTGAYVPEDNVPAALLDLHFEPLERPGPPVALGAVPPVLLSECWNDLHEIAAKAAFDPDWKAKSWG